MEVVELLKCSSLPQPITAQPCRLKPCGVQWYVTEWSAVSILSRSLSLTCPEGAIVHLLTPLVASDTYYHFFFVKTIPSQGPHMSFFWSFQLYHMVFISGVYPAVMEMKLLTCKLNGWKCYGWIHNSNWACISTEYISMTIETPSTDEDHVRWLKASKKSWPWVGIAQIIIYQNIWIIHRTRWCCCALSDVCGLSRLTRTLFLTRNDIPCTSIVLE